MSYRLRVTRAALWVAATLVAMLLPSAFLQGQFTPTSLGGTVTDSSGAAIAGASITAQNTQTGLTKATESGGDQLSGDNLADFLLGDVTSFSQNSPTAYEYQGYNFDLFIRDNWRVNKKLTVNLGLRWDPTCLTAKPTMS